MSRTLHRLTESEIKSFRTESQVRLADGGGLYLVCGSTGRKIWSFMHRGKNGKLTSQRIGEYPALSLTAARDRAAKMRNDIRDGVDPASIKARDETFEKWVRIVLAAKESGERDGRPRAAKTVLRDKRALDLVCDQIGERDIRTLTTSQLDDALRSLTSAESRYRARYLVQEVFAWCHFKEVIKTNPALALDVVHQQPIAKGYSAITDEKEIGALLLKVREYPSIANVEIGLELILRTGVRQGELRLAKWDWLDLEKGFLNLPTEVTKTRVGREVYLSKQSVALFRQLEGDRRKGTEFVLPASRTVRKGPPGGGPLSDMAFTIALRRMGYDKSKLHVHGFRKIVSTLANESGLFRPDVIESYLGHIQPGVRGIYNKATYAKEQRELAQWWSDKLDTLLAGAEAARAFG